MSASESGGVPDPWTILANIWGLMQTVLDESAPALEALGLSTKAFFLLAHVDKVPFPAELARIMHLPPPTVTYIVKQLEARRYLKREPEPDDLRKFRLVLTVAGRKAMLRGREAIATVIGVRLSRVQAEEIITLDRIVSLLAGSAPRN